MKKTIFSALTMLALTITTSNAFGLDGPSYDTLLEHFNNAGDTSWDRLNDHKGMLSRSSNSICYDSRAEVISEATIVPNLRDQGPLLPAIRLIYVNVHDIAWESFSQWTNENGSLLIKPVDGKRTIEIRQSNEKFFIKADFNDNHKICYFWPKS